jgi:MFS family permease
MLNISFAVASPALCVVALSRDLGLDYARQGILFSAAMWFFLVSPAAASLVDRVGFRWVLAAATAVQAAGWWMLASAGGFGQAVAGAACMGLGGAMLDPLLTPLVCAVFPERRARMSNFLHGFYCVGLLLTVGLVVALQQAGVSWRDTFRLLGILCLPTGLLALVLALPTQSHQGDVRQPTRSLLGEAAFWLFAAAIFMAGATEMVAANWLPRYVHDLVGSSGSGALVASIAGDSAGGAVGTPAGHAAAVLPAPEAGSLAAGAGLALFAVLMGAARFLTSALVHRFGPRRLLIGSAALAAMCLVLAALHLPPVLTVASLATVGFGVACMWPTVLALAGDRFPRAGASMYATISAAGGLGCAAGPAVAGWIAERAHGLAPAMGALAVAPLIVLAVAWRLRAAMLRPD